MMTTTTNTGNSNDTNKSHYESHTAESYESAYFYEKGTYTKYLCRLVVERLGLKEQKQEQGEGEEGGGNDTTILVDIGGGTGNFTKMLIDESGNDSLRAIVVDPFLPHNNNTSNDNDHEIIQFVKASAEEYINNNNNNNNSGEDSGDKKSTKSFRSKKRGWRNGYNQILMKEVVHHFAESDRVNIFRGMLNGCEKPHHDHDHYEEDLKRIPSLLIITRPQRDIDYPLWDEAKDVWAKNQPHVDDLMKDLKSAGYFAVDYTVEAYPCEIEFERWKSMVKRRFWSTFHNFTDVQLDAACKKMEGESEAHRIDSNGVIRFEDRLVFIRAYI